MSSCMIGQSGVLQWTEGYQPALRDLDLDQKTTFATLQRVCMVYLGDLSSDSQMMSNGSFLHIYMYMYIYNII